MSGFEKRMRRQVVRAAIARAKASDPSVRRLPARLQARAIRDGVALHARMSRDLQRGASHGSDDEGPPRKGQGKGGGKRGC